MGQAFPLDRGRSGFYYPLVAIGLVCAGACGRYQSIAPQDLHPVSHETAERWASDVRVAQPVKIELRWRFEDQRGASGGRAVVRLAPPDTLRLDYRGPFGRSGSAVVVGTGALWARPRQGFEELIPVAPLFWAALGVPGAPPDGARVFGTDGPARRAWRYVTGDEVVDFIHLRGSGERLLAEMRFRERVLGASEVRFGTTRQPERAMMVFPPYASRFSFTIEAIDTVAAFDPQTWRPW